MWRTSRSTRASARLPRRREVLTLRARRSPFTVTVKGAAPATSSTRTRVESSTHSKGGSSHQPWLVSVRLKSKPAGALMAKFKSFVAREGFGRSESKLTDFDAEYDGPD